MAKPKSAFRSASPATSFLLPSLSQRDISTDHQPSSSRHAIIRTSRPSATLLALLATVAASSSTADGRPLDEDSQPPDFLCPGLASDSLIECPPPPIFDLVHDEEYTGHFYLSPTPTRKKRRAGFVPEKYVQGSDGRWRKEPTWSLYGSTVCECGDDSPPQTAVPEIDDQIDPTPVSSGATTTHISSATDMTTDLPEGWKPGDPKKDISPYILIMSIILAMVICGTIFGCVGWRRKRRSSANKDVEKRLRKHKVLEDDESDVETEEMKRARSQQRIWAKWRAGVRSSARRRKKRIGTTTPSHVDPCMSSDSLASQVSSAMTAISTSITTDDSSNLSHQLSTATRHHESFSQDLYSTNPDVPERLDPPRPSQPPQYADSGSLSATRTRSSFQERLPANDTSDSASVASACASSLDEIPYVPSVAAHIATDDKTLLSRMADLASSPPTEPESSCLTSSHVDSAQPTGPLVPVLDEFERMDLQVLDEDLLFTSSGPSSNRDKAKLPSPRSLSPTLSLRTANVPAPTYSRNPSPPPPHGPSLLPDPPSKSQLNARLFYEYPSSFEEDIDGIEPLPIPSAPPFDFACSNPSAPPGDESEIASVLSALPCAPPLIDEGEGQFGSSYSSAPSSPATPRHGSEIRESEDISVRRSFGTSCACPSQTQSGPPCSCIAQSRPTRPSTSSNDLSPSDGSSARGTPLTCSIQERTVNPPDYLP